MRARTLLLPLTAVTVAFFAVVLPLYAALMWAAIIALIFAPLQRWLTRRLHGRAGWAALLTLSAVTLTVILPLLLLLAALGRQVSLLAAELQSGRIDAAAMLARLLDALPAPLRALLDRLDLADVDAIRRHAEQGAGGAARLFAGQAWIIGQTTLDVVVGLVVALYVAFFLLRDGPALSMHIWDVLPLRARDKRELRRRLAAVVRATVKGNFVVAALQGVLGGLAFAWLDIPGALLWGAVMAALSLLPAVGAALVWGPVALYLASGGALAQGIGLALYGTLVIGLVDNLLRPQLVGRDIRMPDWLVLVTTIGGIALLGINGFVIGPLVAALFITLWGLYGGRSTAARRRERYSRSRSSSASRSP